MVWSALQQKDNMLSVGYKPTSVGNIDNSIHTINIQSAEWKMVKEKLIAQIIESEQRLDKTLKRENILAIEDETLPFINVVVKNFATIELLRKNNTVRYAEPMAYEPQPEITTDSDSGCGSHNAEGGLVAGVDYINITPNAKQSWNYTYHQIPQAWAKSTGAGVKIFVIDTGAI